MQAGAYLPIGQEVQYGAGTLAAGLRAVLDRAACRRAIVVTGPSAWADERLRGYVTSALGDALADVFVEAAQSIRLDAVLRLMEAVEAGGADALLGLGGGSAIDVAKAATSGLAYGLTTAEAWADAFADWDHPAAWPKRSRPLPLQIAVPTTLAGAAHSSGVGLLSGLWTGRRVYEARGRGMQPAVVFLDPRATMATPRQLWLSTAFKALEHAIEKHYSRPPHPIVDSLACEAAATLIRALGQTAEGRDDDELRLELLVGSWMAMFGGAPGLKMGLAHAFGRQISGLGKVRQGLVSCVTLAPVLRFNLPAIEPNLASVARHLDGGGGPGRAGRRDGAASLIATVAAIAPSLGLPRTLRDLGLEREAIPAIADHVLGDHGLAGNPIRPTRQDLIGLMEAMYEPAGE